MTLVAAGLACLALTGCPVVEETGEAIDEAAEETGDAIEDVVE